MKTAALETIKVLSLQKAILYLVIITAFFGPAFFLVDIGGFHMFPFRFFLLFLWLVFVLYILLNQGNLNVSHIKVKYYLCFLAAWAFYAVLSLGWANSLIDAVRQIIFLVMGISIIVFVVWHFTKLKDFKRLFYLWLLMLLPILGLGLWNHLTGQHLSAPEAIIASERLRYMPTATFYNPNSFALYLALSISFILVFIRYASNKLISLFGIGVLLLTLYLLLATLARANYLAVILGVAFWFLFLLKLKKKLKVAALSILLLFLLFTVFPNHLKDIASNVGVQIGGLVAGIEQQGGATIDVRINLMRNSFVFLWEHFGFGVGAGNIEYHIINYQIYDTRGAINVHNWWIEILANYGVFIFMGYILFYFGIFINLYRAYGKLTEKTEKMICETLLVGLVIFPMASFSPGSVMALGPMWIFFAFALGFLNYYRIKQVREKI